MVCHWLHEVVILGNKSIVISWDYNLIRVCKVVAVHSTWLSTLIIAERWLSCRQLLLGNLLLIDCITVIVCSFHILCYNIIFAWHLNVVTLRNFENVLIQIFICNASWIVSKVVLNGSLHLVLSDWLSLCIITLLPSWMVCSGIRIVCWCGCLLVLIVCPIKTIFQIINTVTKILMLRTVTYNIQTNLTLMSFILNSQCVFSIRYSS